MSPVTRQCKNRGEFFNNKPRKYEGVSRKLVLAVPVCFADP